MMIGPLLDSFEWSESCVAESGFNVERTSIFSFIFDVNCDLNFQGPYSMAVYDVCLIMKITQVL